MSRIAFLCLVLGGCNQNAAGVFQGNDPSVRPPFKGGMVRGTGQEMPPSNDPQPPSSEPPTQPPVDDVASGPPYPVVLMHGMFGFQNAGVRLAGGDAGLERRSRGDDQAVH
jgi:hypothetical protein